MNALEDADGMTMTMTNNTFRSKTLSPILADFPLTCLDVGARGGVEQDLMPIAAGVNALAFEPDAEECKRLNKAAADNPGPWKSLRHVPVALSGSGGKRSLHVPECPDSASLLPHDLEVGKAFKKSHMFDERKRIEVDTVTLDEACRSFQIEEPHYLKMDIEGAEYEVFAASQNALDQLLVIKTEVSFIPMRKEQPLASDVDVYLRKRGFLLMDLVSPMHWRVGPHVAHPQIAKAEIPYSRARLAHADYLYFRDPETIEPGIPSVPRLIRGGILAMTHGYFDHAAALWERPEVSSFVHNRYGSDVSTIIRRASMSIGREMWLSGFRKHIRAISPFVRSLRNMKLW